MEKLEKQPEQEEQEEQTKSFYLFSCNAKVKCAWTVHKEAILPLELRRSAGHSPRQGGRVGGAGEEH